MNWLILVILLFALPCYADEIDDIIPYIIQVESGGNPDVVSSKGAVGLMQITPIVLKEYNLNAQPEVTDNKLVVYQEYHYEDLFIVESNIEIGTWYLRRLRDYYLKDVKFNFYTIMGVGGVIFNNPKGKEELLMAGCKDFPNILCNEDYRLALILAAYNGGITELRKNNYDINKMPKETREYIKKVMKAYIGD